MPLTSELAPHPQPFLPSPGHGGFRPLRGDTSGASRAGSGRRSTTSQAATRRRPPTQQSPADKTRSRSSPRRSGTSPSTRTEALHAPHRPPARQPAAPGSPSTNDAPRRTANQHAREHDRYSTSEG